MTQLAITQLGDKKDRTYRVQQVFTNLDTSFIVKNMGKSFAIFINDQQIASFKTLTKCYEYIKSMET